LGLFGSTWGQSGFNLESDLGSTWGQAGVKLHRLALANAWPTLYCEIIMPPSAAAQWGH
jgi:hypothetical protein